MTTHRIKYTESWATISPCQRYRYELGRRWGDGAMLTWVMLNPSTADAGEDDPTIRRCAQFSQDYGFHGLVVRNLFAYRATNPKELARVEDSVGSDNDVPLLDKIVFAWGSEHACSTASSQHGYPLPGCTLFRCDQKRGPAAPTLCTKNAWVRSIRPRTRSTCRVEEMAK